MEQDEKDIELIEAYYKGKLSAQNLSEFEMRRERDQEFNRQVEDYTHIMSEIRVFGEQNFMQKLAGWEQEITGEKKAKVIPMGRILSIAAVIIIILIPIGYLLLSDQFTATNEQLFATYFQPYDDVISERSDGSGLLEKGLGAYNQENYQDAITYFQGYLEANPHEFNIRSYLGISYLAVGNVQQAEYELKQVVSNSSGLFKEVSEWYLTLAYLLSDQETLMEEQLKRIIAQPDHIFVQNATELFESVN